ncbi:MAG TPA: Ig-like domain-containing protein, partial [Thermoplasmata archaeon]|nr:Ig-like domain-containing protein [Thermoplasmata archaeon]
ADGELDVQPRRSITIEFDRDMAADETAASITVSPPLTGTRIVVTSRTALVVHVQDLEWNATYTVTVSTDARSMERVRLAAPYSFAFATASAPRPPASRTAEQDLSPGFVALVVLVLALAALLAILVASSRRARRSSAGRVVDPAQQTKRTDLATVGPRSAPEGRREAPHAADTQVTAARRAAARRLRPPPNA